MAVNVKTSSNTINVRVGQADAVKVLSSAAKLIFMGKNVDKLPKNASLRGFMQLIRM